MASPSIGMTLSYGQLPPAFLNRYNQCLSFNSYHYLLVIVFKLLQSALGMCNNTK